MSESAGVAAVILAAGFSRRLGQPKQTLLIDGEMLVERAARVAHEAGLAPVIVVVNQETAFGKALLAQGCLVVVNRQAAEGMASSIRCGAQRAQEQQLSGIVLMTCDQVALRPEHLRLLCQQAARITGSSYAGRTGVPAYFPASSFAALLQLQGDAGARELLRDSFAISAEELDLDVDTAEDAERARATLADSGRSSI